MIDSNMGFAVRSCRDMERLTEGTLALSWKEQGNRWSTFPWQWSSPTPYLHWLRCCQRRGLYPVQSQPSEAWTFLERSDLSFSILSQCEKKLKGTKKEGWLELAGYVGDTEEVFGDVDLLPSVVMRSASWYFGGWHFSGWHEEATYHTTPECSLSLTAHLPVIKIAWISLDWWWSKRLYSWHA